MNKKKYFYCKIKKIVKRFTPLETNLYSTYTVSTLVELLLSEKPKSQRNINEPSYLNFVENYLRKIIETSEKLQMNVCLKLLYHCGLKIYIVFNNHG